MEPFRFMFLFVAILLSYSEARPQLFGGGHGGGILGGFDVNNREHLATAGAGLGILGAGAFAIKNYAEGNDNIRLAPTIGASLDSNGNINPQFGIVGKVGDGDLVPTFNGAIQLNSEGGITPVVGGGVSAFNDGPIGVNGNTGFAIGPNGKFTPNAGVAATIGQGFSLGSPSQKFGGPSNNFNGRGSPLNFGGHGRQNTRPVHHAAPAAGFHAGRTAGLSRPSDFHRDNIHRPVDQSFGRDIHRDNIHRPVDQSFGRDIHRNNVRRPVNQSFGRDIHRDNIHRPVDQSFGRDIHGQAAVQQARPLSRDERRQQRREQRRQQRRQERLQNQQVAGGTRGFAGRR